jgi:NAD(P)-dependent dehydrogenase (short-subunit alcohol dehydrogenase family)
VGDRDQHGLDCYTAAKGGIAAITRSMAAEFAPQKVRVNAIAPAATMTNRVRGYEVCGSSGIADPKANAPNRLFIIGPEVAQTQSKPRGPKYMTSSTE